MTLPRCWKQTKSSCRRWGQHFQEESSPQEVEVKRPTLRGSGGSDGWSLHGFGSGLVAETDFATECIAICVEEASIG